MLQLNNKNCYGFTLMEMIVATFIASLLMVFISKLLLETSRFEQRRQADFKIMKEARELNQVTGDGVFNHNGLRGDNLTQLDFTSTTNTWSMSKDRYVKTTQNTVTLGDVSGQYNYESDTAPESKTGYVENIVMNFDNSSVVNTDGKKTNVYVQTDLVEPDVNRRLDTETAKEQWWWLFTVNTGKRL
ncbi:MAG: prepilin-type N-terminal cleavage/methylation domain-containing protein [Nitrospirae bacterium]|nr:prepilin-type N-terminal cleavage/methylation domain-containing protein [Nitrospirota bacterium]